MIARTFSRNGLQKTYSAYSGISETIGPPEGFTAMTMLNSSACQFTPASRDSSIGFQPFKDGPLGFGPPRCLRCRDLAFVGLSLKIAMALQQISHCSRLLRVPYHLALVH